jgi:hypothetical protein
VQKHFRTKDSVERWQLWHLENDIPRAGEQNAEKKKKKEK